MASDVGRSTGVLVLGSDGMLGSMVVRVLQDDPTLRVVASSRHGRSGTVSFDAGRDLVAELLEVTGCDWIVNAIGVLGGRIDETDPASIAMAIEANAALPNRLAAAAGPDRRILQIATDGVYSGGSGPYDEEARPDAPGVYARSKSLGEVRSSAVVNLRCSIIGPEAAPGRSLLTWALGQPAGSTVVGYSNHLWNGVTSYHFARLCRAVIHSGRDGLPGILHIVPADTTTKAELLVMLLAAFGRSDVSVVPEPAPAAIDRRLSTVHPAVNRALWREAGYPEPPTIQQMVRELAAFDT